MHGDEGARIAAASHTAAIEFIDAFVHANGVECDFTRLDGFLFLAEGDTPDALDEEHDAARLAGPHLECIVHWNTLETSWDCPCHGSRFDAYGKVFTGPAVSSLEPVDVDGKPRSKA